jgi:hypothetical protein
MRQLVARFGKAVKAVLTGFDRIVFKGTILPLAHEDGAMSFLRWRGVLNRDYKKWMQEQTDALVTSVDRYAREQAGIHTGLIGAWSCLEGCRSYRAHYCAQKGYPQSTSLPLD